MPERVGAGLGQRIAGEILRILLSVIAGFVLTYTMGLALVFVGAVIAVTTGFIPGQHIDLDRWMAWFFDYATWKYWITVSTVAVLVWWASRRFAIVERQAEEDRD